ncbi:MAG: LamG-like jellyroll fold domain-containing protein [Nanoarchaeota archaeon]|nr:DNRLRE domain-containing protein [Nanoarchaeota archaeon]MBU1632051.1 DNRLRE domain-containing protein [Nanoarchaeota archaeon]MBU1875822.1 DNRLRE domain-containing protein [Nanoarchaeota archaeon]
MDEKRVGGEEEMKRSYRSNKSNVNNRKKFFFGLTLIFIVMGSFTLLHLLGKASITGSTVFEIQSSQEFKKDQSFFSGIFSSIKNLLGYSTESTTSTKPVIIKSSETKPENILKIEAKKEPGNELTISASPTTVKLDSDKDVADLHGYDANIGQFDYAIQMKWNISSIPASVTINDATLCLYITNQYAKTSKSADIRRVNDQSWTESLTISSFNSQSLTNQVTDKTWSSATASTYSCINITEQVKTDYDLEHDYASIRIYDPNYFLNTATNVLDQTTMRYGYYVNYFYFASAENSNNKPYLNITYTSSVNNVPNITLNTQNDSDFTINVFNVILNSTITDLDSDTTTVKFFADDSSSISAANGLVYQEENVASGSILTYNLTSLPVTPDGNTKLLFHFDNRSEFSENNALFYDFSGTGNNGTCSNCPSFNLTGGKFAGAYRFDGSNDYLNVSNDASLNLNDMSIEVWVKRTADSSWKGIVEKGSAGNQYRLRFIGSNAIDFTVSGFGTLAATKQIPLNTWTHIIATYDDTANGNDVMKIYIDGVINATSSLGWGTANHVSSPIIIGALGAPSHYFPGYIDEVAIYNKVLSADEVFNRYRLVNNTYYWYVNASDGTNETQSETRQFKINPPAAAQAAPSITPNTPENNSNFVARVFNIIINTTITDVNNDPSTVKFFAGNSSSISNAHGLIYQKESVSSGSSINYNITSLPLTPDSSTKLLFHFDNRSEYGENDMLIYDFSENGNNGTCSNCPAFNLTGGKFAGAPKFDGSNDYVSVSNDASLNLNDMTIELWIKRTSDASWNGIVEKGNNNQYRLKFAGNNKIDFLVSGFGNLVTTKSIPLNTWTHIAATFNDTDNGNDVMRIYIDGVLQAYTPPRWGTPATTDSQLVIGALGSLSHHFPGYIDELAIHNKTLGAEEIKEHYKLKEGAFYWKVNASDGTDSTQSEARLLNVNEQFLPPNIDECDGAECTTLNSDTASSIQSKNYFTWQKANKGKIKFLDTVNLSNALIGNDDDVSNDIEIGDGFIFVDSSMAPAFANKAANITFENVSCNQCNGNDILYASGYNPSLAEIQADGQSCNLAGKCSNFVCADNTCSFIVTSFTGYASEGNANLTINDSAEGSYASTSTSIDFFAYYVNATSGEAIADGSCNVSFDDAPSIWNPMTWNGTGDGSYNYTKSSGFISTGTHGWNVTCAYGNFSTLLANDTIVIISGGGAVPEFEDYAILFILITIISGFFIMKKKNI